MRVTPFNQQSSFTNPAKRLFDILVSALGLLLLSPFFVIIAWAIKRESPGPVFYRGRRAGRGGREFSHRHLHLLQVQV